MKIPDDVYDARCRYCQHRRAGAENVEIPDDRLSDPMWARSSPCKIVGICRCGKIPGECLDFTPNPMFGICQFCEFTNNYRDGYCTVPSGPVNKRRVCLGWGTERKINYWNGHALFVCDRYQVDRNWKSLIMKAVLEGRSPSNFDPDTWEPLDKLEGTPAGMEWERLQDEEREKTEAAEVRKATREPADDTGQMSLFEMSE